MALETELDVFQAKLPELLADEGEFALVRGKEVTVWPSVDAALDAGYDRYGLEPFLVKEITEHEKAKYFSRTVARCP